MHPEENTMELEFLSGSAVQRTCTSNIGLGVGVFPEGLSGGGISTSEVEVDPELDEDTSLNLWAEE